MMIPILKAGEFTTGHNKWVIHLNLLQALADEFQKERRTILVTKEFDMPSGRVEQVIGKVEDMKVEGDCLMAEFDFDPGPRSIWSAEFFPTPPRIRGVVFLGRRSPAIPVLSSVEDDCKPDAVVQGNQC